MRIIGHRGAAGLALENTQASLRKAKQLGLDGIEIDARLTRDRRLVLCHDKDLKRISGRDLVVAQHNLAELQAVELRNGEHLITLEDALRELPNEWVIIDAKDDGCQAELLAALDKFPGRKLTVACFNHEFARQLKLSRPNLPVYLAEHTKPTEIFEAIRQTNANGMDLNAWLLNPLTYWLAKRRRLDIVIYTINSPFVAKFINFFYPDVAVVTDYPDRFVGARRHES